MLYRKKCENEREKRRSFERLKTSIGQSHQRSVYPLSKMTTNMQSPSLRPCLTPGRQPQGLDPVGHLLVRELLIRFDHR